MFGVSQSRGYGDRVDQFTFSERSKRRAINSVVQEATGIDPIKTPKYKKQLLQHVLRYTSRNLNDAIEVLQYALDRCLKMQSSGSSDDSDSSIKIIRSTLTYAREKRSDFKGEGDRSIPEDSQYRMAWQESGDQVECAPTREHSLLPVEILLTEGNGDCAFHAFFGEYSDGRIVYDSVTEKRQEFGELVQHAEEGSPLNELRTEGIKALVMGGTDIGAFSPLRNSYQSFVQENSGKIESSWREIEAVLLRNDELLNLIESNHTLGINSTLKAQFMQVLANEDPDIRSQIDRLPELRGKIEEYNRVANMEFSWQEHITDDVIEGYSHYLSQPQNWLLPVELQMMAFAFDHPIHFYNHNSEGAAFRQEIYNSNGAGEPIHICFNGRDHYERVQVRPLSEYELLQIPIEAMAQTAMEQRYLQDFETYIDVLSQESQLLSDAWMDAEVDEDIDVTENKHGEEAKDTLAKTETQPTTQSDGESLGKVSLSTIESGSEHSSREKSGDSFSSGSDFVRGEKSSSEEVSSFVDPEKKEAFRQALADRMTEVKGRRARITRRKLKEIVERSFDIGGLRRSKVRSQQSLRRMYAEISQRKRALLQKYLQAHPPDESAEKSPANKEEIKEVIADLILMSYGKRKTVLKNQTSEQRRGELSKIKGRVGELMDYFMLKDKGVYVDLNTIHPNFPGIDAIYVDEDGLLSIRQLKMYSNTEGLQSSVGSKVQDIDKAIKFIKQNWDSLNKLFEEVFSIHSDLASVIVDGTFLSDNMAGILDASFDYIIPSDMIVPNLFGVVRSVGFSTAEIDGLSIEIYDKAKEIF